MRDHLDIGSSPGDESTASVGSENYYPRARRECRAYINLLRRVFGPEPEGASLAVKSNPHDFGNYLSVVCYFDSNNEAAITYAYKLESEGPENWDEEARQELADDSPARSK